MVEKAAFMKAEQCNAIFRKCIEEYHRDDDVDSAIRNPFAEETIEGMLYRKNWIDTVQWHLEDIIRRPDLPAIELVAIKRRIDASNQARTELVEKIDDWMLDALSGHPPRPDARMNSETPAWILDRLSILALKIYHMKEQTVRTDVDAEHREICDQKLKVLEEQERDLSRAFDELLEDIREGSRYVKVYRQMKMYNDENLNPQLYAASPGKENGS